MEVNGKAKVNPLTGWALLIGGLMWIIFWTLIAKRPEGIPSGPYRDFSDLGIWIVISYLLMLVGVSGLYFRWKNGIGKLGKFSMWILWMTFALIALLIAWNKDLDGVWFIFIYTVYLHILAYILFSISTIKTKLIPRTVSLLLIVSVLLFLAFNTEDLRIWLAIPFGMTWGFLLGYLSLVGFKQR